MTKYEDLPSALGASVGQAKIKRCDYCGEIFSTIFEEADHLLEYGEEPFDPHYLLSEDAAIGLGSLMRDFYINADDPEAIRELSEEIYSVLLVAEFTPDLLNTELDALAYD